MSNADEIGDFLDQVWKDTEGYVYLPVKAPEGFKKYMIPWPEKRAGAIRHILKFSALEGHEVFFSPALYKSPKPSQENVIGAWVAWADFDGNAPEKWPTNIAPMPTIEIQSSGPGKKHVYWAFDEFQSAKAVQEINRRLAYALQADLSGWDANQFLRPPFSVNRKYSKPLPVTIVKNRMDRVYTQDSFSKLPTPKEAIRASVDVNELPSITEVLAEASWDAELIDLFETSGADMQHQGRDRSAGLQRIAYEGAEHGWTDEQILTVLYDVDDRWEKYTGRPSREKILIDLINRARVKVGYNSESELLDLAARFRDTSKVEDDSEDKVLYSPFELAHMKGIEDWIVEGVLTPRGIGHITGRSGVGKTQFAMQLGADLASGRSHFLDKKLPGKPMKVLVLSLEMNQYQLPHMMKPLVERYPELPQDMMQIFAVGEMLPLEQEAGQAYLEALLDEVKPDIVIADSLSFMSSADLTSDDDMKKLFGFLHRARNRHDFGMVIVHHHRKKANDAQSKKQADTQHDVYGSFVIASTVDFIMNLEERPEDVEEKTITLSMLKSRYSATPEPVKLTRSSKLHFTVLEDLARKFLEGAVQHDENTPSLSI